MKPLAIVITLTATSFLAGFALSPPPPAISDTQESMVKVETSVVGITEDQRKKYIEKEVVEKEYIEKEVVEKEYVRKDKVLDYVREMDPESYEADIIRKFAKSYQGPWERPAEEELIIGVPGTVNQGKAHVCPEHYGQKYKLQGTAMGESIIVEASTYMWNADDCLVRSEGLQMQISCADAKRIFPEEIKNCLDNQPQWNLNYIPWKSGDSTTGQLSVSARRIR